MGLVACDGTEDNSSVVGTGGTAATGGTLVTGGGGGHSENGSGGSVSSLPTGGDAGNGGNAGSATSGAGGGSVTGGSGGGSVAGGTGGGTASCPFPTSFKWSSTGPLATPKSPSGHNFVSLKDFTDVYWNNQHVVYATVYDTTVSQWNMVNFNFADWSQADSASQYYMANSPTKGGVAPTLIYFSPKNIWVLAYQWGFTYATSTDPTQPSKWSSGKNLLTNGPSGAIDQTVICDDTNCYLFFAADNGNVYRSQMPIGNFPGTFDGYTTILTDTKANLYESVQVYSVKGTGKYLMIVEAMGSGGRYFRAFSATNLGGTFTAISGASTEASPFAGKANVTFPAGAWTNDISHGDMVRNDPSETQTIDPCNMQFLYQGYDKTQSVSDYKLLPYRPAVLTKTN